MERKDVLEALRELCAKVMCVPPDAVVPQARLVADLGADSLDLIELGVRVREVFGVAPEPAELEGVDTIDDVADLVVRLRAHTGAVEHA